jgi:rubredoxin
LEPGTGNLEPRTGGCPECGAQRLRSAPIPLVSAVIDRTSGKRRYRCSACQWIGWQHRLQRRNAAPGGGEEIFDAQAARKKEAWYFVVVMLAFLLFLGVVMKNCADDAPPPPSDVSQIEICSVSRLSRL